MTAIAAKRARRDRGVVALIALVWLTCAACVAQSDSRAPRREAERRPSVARQPAANPPSAAQASNLDLVTRVVDGDTLVLRYVGKVRLIGIDTPETVDPRKPVQRFGKEASAFTRRLVGGQQVRVEYDWNRRDRYERTLAYIYLLDGTFVNAEIIRQGYGFAYLEYPFKFSREFAEIEREARRDKKGLWSDASP